MNRVLSKFSRRVCLECNSSVLVSGYKETIACTCLWYSESGRTILWFYPNRLGPDAVGSEAWGSETRLGPDYHGPSGAQAEHQPHKLANYTDGVDDVAENHWAVGPLLFCEGICERGRGGELSQWRCLARLGSSEVASLLPLLRACCAGAIMAQFLTFLLLLSVHVD